MLCVSEPSTKSRPFGDLWDNCERCPYCDKTGYSSWHFFGLISEKCDKCFGLGWLTEERYKKLVNGENFGKAEEENGDEKRTRHYAAKLPRLHGRRPQQSG